MPKRAWIARGLLKDKVGKLCKSSYGFRKRFKTKCELAGMKPLNIETIQGHDTGIAGSSYYRPTEVQLLDDYLLAVDSLTVSDENRLKNKVVQLTRREDEVQAMRYRHELEMKELR